MKQMQKGRRRQAGFTIIELSVVMVIVIVLLAAVGRSVWKSREEAKVTGVKQFFMKDAPQAITAYLNLYGGTAGMNKTTLVARGLNDMTEWSVAWTVTGPTSNMLQFTYPMTGADDMDTVGAATAANLTNAGGVIASATYTSPNLVVRIKVN